MAQALLEFMPLPIFQNGPALSASDLNLLSMACQYLGDGPPINYATPMIGWHSRRVLLHRHRYLHWRIWDVPITNGIIRIGSGTNQYTVNGTSGVIDLAPLGIPQEQWYDIYWDHATPDISIQGMYFLEHPTNDMSLSLPYAMHDFYADMGQTAVTSAEEHLNSISGNLEYLIENYKPDIAAGFPIQVTSLRPHASDTMRRDKYYHIQHTLRYLHVGFRHSPNSPDGVHSDWGLRMSTAYPSSDIIYGDGSSEGNDVWYEVCVDLEGSDHEVLHNRTGGSTTFNTPPSISKRQWYQVNLRFTANDPNAIDDAVIFFVCETPTKDPIL